MAYRAPRPREKCAQLVLVEALGALFIFFCVHLLLYQVLLKHLWQRRCLLRPTMVGLVARGLLSHVDA